MPKEKKKLRHSLSQSHSRRSKANPEALSLKELRSIAKAHHVRKVLSYSKSELVDKILEALSDSSSSSSVSDSSIAKLTTEIKQLTLKTKKPKKSLDEDGVEETKEPSPSEASRDRKSRAAKKIQKLLKRRTQKRASAATKLQTMTRKRQAINRFKDMELIKKGKIKKSLHRLNENSLQYMSEFLPKGANINSLKLSNKEIGSRIKDNHCPKKTVKREKCERYEINRGTLRDGFCCSKEKNNYTSRHRYITN